jgi:DHA2 family multidrug resistance protein
MDATTTAGGGINAATFARNIAVACAMAAMFMQTLDQTIANVALPHMQGGLSASRDQITWVLTSYIIATAIMTAPVGWLAARFGKRNCIIVAVAGFTLSSALCGMAQNLDQMVLFRILQGAFGAALGPLSQTMMMDMFPPEQRGSVMGIWGMGVMLGPILGPTLGGYLTDSFSWRWVFYINVPVGIACVVGLLLFYRDPGKDRTLTFDWLGFSLLALGLGALQMMLDRGTGLDWFSSTEIVIEGVLALIGLYLFAVHMMTSKRTFIRFEVFKDRNFTSATLLMFITGGMLVSSSALLAPFLQNLGGYPVTDAGLLMMPRGVGTMLSMAMVGRIAMRFDPRKVITFGAILLLATTYHMSTWSPAVSASTIGWVGFIQGFGMGFIFVPMNLVAFATIPPEIRTDASAIMNLLRNIGAAVSVTMTTVVLTRTTHIVHAQVAEHVDPFNRALGVNAPSMMLNPQMPFGLGSLDGMISRAALEVAYANDFLFLFYVSIPAVLLVWLMKRPELPGAIPPGRR